MRISCAHVLCLPAVNGSVWGCLGAEIDTGLPHYTRVCCECCVTWFGQVWISSLTFTRCVCRHVRDMCAHAGATRQVEGVCGRGAIHRKPPHLSMGVCGWSEVCRVWTTCSRWRACGRISCAHVLRTLAPNGSLSTRLGAEIDTGLPQHTRVRCDTQVGQLCVFSLTFARCVRKHVRHVRAHAGASRQVERCRG